MPSVVRITTQGKVKAAQAHELRAPGHREQPDRSIVNAKINPS